MPSLALQRAFANAVDGGRRGETVLLALLALGPGGPAEASPALLRNVIEGLRRIQMEDAAPAIALEAAVAAGLLAFSGLSKLSLKCWGPGRAPPPIHNPPFVRTRQG